MKSSHLFKISKYTKWIVLIGAFILIGVAILFVLFGLSESESDNSHPLPMFSLNDTKYDYILLRSPNGAYVINYKYIYNNKPNDIDALIGSSKINIEPLVGKKVKIHGEYRKVFGAALCWDTTKCSENKLDKKTFTVIDIENIEIVK